MSSSFQNTGSYSKFLDQSCRGVFLGCRQRCEDAENSGYEFEMLKVYPGSEEVSYNEVPSLHAFTCEKLYCMQSCNTKNHSDCGILKTTS